MPPRWFRRGQQDLAQWDRGDLRQGFGQFNGGDVGVAARAEGHAVQLVFDCGHDPGMGVADLVGAVAVKIQDFTSLQIFQTGAAAFGEHIQARRGKVLANESVDVPFQPFPGVGVNMT